LFWSEAIWQGEIQTMLEMRHMIKGQNSCYAINQE